MIDTVGLLLSLAMKELGVAFGAVKILRVEGVIVVGIKVAGLGIKNILLGDMLELGA